MLARCWSLPVDPGAIVASVLEDLKLAIDESGAIVRVSKLPVIDGKPEYLALLFQNLIANAIKYRSAEKPEISIDATRDGDYWKVAIKDNGIGFEMEYAEKIFVMFQRLHQDEYPGTGLGLSMCKKIVLLQWQNLVPITKRKGLHVLLHTTWASFGSR